MRTIILTTTAFLLTALSAFAQPGQWQHFDKDNSPLHSDAVTAIEVNDLGIWVGSAQGLVRMGSDMQPDFGPQSAMMPQSRVNDIHTSADGAVWVATDRGLARFADRQWQVWDTDNSSIPTDLLRAVTSDADGNIWIGTWGSGLLRFRENEWEVFNTMNSDIPSNGVNDVMLDEQGRLWVGTHAGGAALLDGGQWTVYHAGNSGLPSADVLSIGQSEDGALWFGTYQGLARLGTRDKSGWEVFTSMYFDHMVGTFRQMALGEDGQLWIATDGGLLQWSDGMFRFLHTANSEIASNSLSAVAADARGNILVGHMQHGLDVYNPDGVALPLDPKPLREAMTLEVYPNPTTDILNVRIPVKGDANMTLTVTDLTGRTVLDMRMSAGAEGHRVDVSRLPRGTYLLTMRSANGVASAPFVKG